MIESDDPKVVARVLSIMLDSEANAAANMTPEQTAIQALQTQLEEMRSELSTANYYREQAQKKLAEATADTPKVDA